MCDSYLDYRQIIRKMQNEHEAEIKHAEYCGAFDLYTAIEEYAKEHPFSRQTTEELEPLLVLLREKITAYGYINLTAFYA